MSRVRMAQVMDARGFPRVSGDEPDYAMRQDIDGTFSPRERG